MDKPRLVVDFNNQDVSRRLRLDCVGTLRDLERQQIKLSDGMELTLYADDANEYGQPQQTLADGIVEYSEADETWVAKIDWHAIR